MATLNGINYAKSVSDPIEKVKGELNAKLKVLKEKYVMSAALTSGDEILGPSLPEGALVIDAYLKTSASLGATGTLDMGYKAFTDEDGNSVAEDQDALVQALDGVGAAALKRALGASVGLGKKVGVGGAQVFAKATADSTATDVTIEMVVIYAID